jgi:nucleotide-binding universal stress UspA family protein
MWPPPPRRTLPGENGRKERVMKTFVVATDGSPSAREALRYALDLAARVGAVVHAVRVAPESDWTALPGPVPAVRVPHTPDQADREPLDQAAELARDCHVPMRTELLAGNTVDEIVAYADSVDADLVILGSRGHGAIAGTVLGSVSLGVLHEAMRPVLVVRGEKAHELSLARSA